MDSAWKSNASAVHERNPTTKYSQSRALSWANRLMGFFKGSGDCHSVCSSPYSFRTTTRCFQMNRSFSDCLAVGKMPLAMGSAGSLADDMVSSPSLDYTYVCTEAGNEAGKTSAHVYKTVSKLRRTDSHVDGRPPPVIYTCGRAWDWDWDA